MLPHSEKIIKGGEDAVGLAEQLLVVSDGVGGWTMSGVDPALYSRQLVTNCVDIFSKRKDPLARTEAQV